MYRYAIFIHRKFYLKKITFLVCLKTYFKLSHMFAVLLTGCCTHFSHRGEMKSPPSRTFYVTDSPWQTSSLPRNTNNSSGYHGYQDSTVSSGRGSLFEGREDQYGSNSRGLDDSSYGTLEEKHTRSGSKDSLDNGTYGEYL